MERQRKSTYSNFFGIGTILFCFLMALSALWLFITGAQSQLPTGINREEFDQRITLFFDALQKGNSTALEDFVRGGPLGTTEANVHVVELRNKVDGLQEQFGNIITWERLEPKRIGTNFVLVQYVLMYEHYPVVWTFAFYRKPSSTPSIVSSASGTWGLIELSFDTDVKNLL